MGPSEFRRLAANLSGLSPGTHTDARTERAYEVHSRGMHTLALEALATGRSTEGTPTRMTPQQLVTYYRQLAQNPRLNAEQQQSAQAIATALGARTDEARIAALTQLYRTNEGARTILNLVEGMRTNQTVYINGDRATPAVLGTPERRTTGADGVVTVTPAVPARDATFHPKPLHPTPDPVTNPRGELRQGTFVLGSLEDGSDPATRPGRGGPREDGPAIG